MAHRVASDKNIALHLFTIFVTAATLFLIVAGALVTSNGAGLATTDWPLSYGQVFPPMVGNLFYEHGHRLIASSVGLMVIALNIWLWLREPRRWVRRLGLAALGAVIIQGLLGGLTVKLMLPVYVSAVHASLAQFFFCMMVSLSVFTAPGWRARSPAVAPGDGPLLTRAGIAACAAIFAQLGIGATLRHSASWDQHLPTSLVIAHVIGAGVVVVVLSRALYLTLSRYENVSYLTRPAILAALLLGTQLVLGLWSYLTRLQSPHDFMPLNPMIWVTVAHVATGASLLATTLVLTLRAYRVLATGARAAQVSYQPVETNA